MEQNNINKKSINNAISAYFILFLSIIFIFNKKNKYLNNNFVKSHTKFAFLIHLGFLLNYIIFIHFSFLKNISILKYNLNYILTSTIFTFLFIIMLYGIYKANKSETFKIGDLEKIGKTNKIIDINGDGIVSEKDKLTLILSYIPFIGYLIQGKYYKNNNIKNIIKFNLLISTIISIIYISGNKNIAILLILFYIIFAVFSSINIIVKNKVIGLDLNLIPNISECVTYLKVFILYLKNYSQDKDFLGIVQLKNTLLEKKYKIEKLNEVKLKGIAQSKVPNFLIYLPFINIFLLFIKKKNKKIHIINGIMITIFFIIFSILGYFNYIPNNSYIILLFPIFFGLGYINSRPAYKIPIIFDFFEILVYIKNIFKKTQKNIQEKKEEEHSEVMKVGEIKKSTES